MTDEVKPIDIVKIDDSNLTQNEKKTLESLFPETVGNTTTLSSSTTPIKTKSSVNSDSVLDSNFTKKAINTTLLTVLFVILYSIDVTKMMKKPNISPMVIFIGKMTAFMILTFLLLYYNC